MEFGKKAVFRTLTFDINVEGAAFTITVFIYGCARH